MLKYLVDANLPYYFSLWNNNKYLHVLDINPEMKDSDIWEYAKQNNLVIITKDADFTNMVLLSNPPPKVIHVKLGNMKIKEFHVIISNIWKDVLNMSNEYKLVRVYKNQLEGLG